jgi:hypothetical protein
MAHFKKPSFDYVGYSPGYPKKVRWKVVSGNNNLDPLQMSDIICCKEDEEFFDKTLGGLKRGFPEGYDPEYIPDDLNAPVSFLERL